MRTAIKRALAVAAGGAIALAPALLPSVASAQEAPNTVYVSPTGTPGAANTSCDTAAYSVIDAAIAAVATRGTVVVCEGTYQQTATVDKTLTLMGRSGAVIDATGAMFDIHVTADGVTVHGLTVEHGSVGIQATANHTTITGNRLLQVNEGHPGAGIGIGGSYSRVSDNFVQGARGFGIGLDDRFGTVSHNQVVGNRVDSTVGLAGIVMQSFGGAGGVFANIVRDNVVENSIAAPDSPNGQGGAGVLLGMAEDWPCMVFPCTESTPATGGSAPAGDASGVYRNTVVGNSISGNGWPGVMVIGPVPDSGSDMNGNLINGNQIETNNLTGTSLLFLSTEVSETTGIMVASPTPLSIRLVGNVISDNDCGIWKNDLVSASSLNSDRYVNVGVSVCPAP